MQEYTIFYQEGLAKGLRVTDHKLRNDGGLIRADGLLVETGELFNLEELSMFDISDIGECEFPYPQIFQLRNWTLICTATKIYSYNGTTLTLVYTAEEGSTWTVGDFYDYLLLTNGKELVVLDPEDGTWSKYLDCAIPNCLCLCDVNGQIFVGGPEVTISAGF